MTWVRVDDHFDEHVKFARAGPLGVALWISGLAYCNRNLTDGFIPWTVARTLVSWQFLGPQNGDPRGAIVYQIAVTTGMKGDDVDWTFVTGLLLDAGLWEEVEGGYRVHDYGDYQPTKEQVEAERAKKVAAGQAGGRATAAARGEAHPLLNAVAGGAPDAVAPAQAKTQPVPKPGPVPGPGSKPKPERERTCEPTDLSTIVDNFETDAEWFAALRRTRQASPADDADAAEWRKDFDWLRENAVRISDVPGILRRCALPRNAYVAPATIRERLEWEESNRAQPQPD